MKKIYPAYLQLVVIGLVGVFCAGLPENLNAQISFAQSDLNFNGTGSVSSGVTSLMYGPDDRLYVAEYPGTIKILTIQRNDVNDYMVTNVESLSGVTDIVNHDDDGAVNSGQAQRETTGLTVAGTATNPVIYVTSSDFRIGAGSGGGFGDLDLDTNSGIITRFTWNGSSWDVVDLVRGLPRSEENHATNGLEFVTVNGTDYLIVASGGNTNGGGPSTNFVFACEYALSGAILSINLDMLNGMGIQVDSDGRNHIYDLPTLDDPSRANVNGITDSDNASYNGIDVNDPFGGNDGLNQAMIVPGGPVQIFSPGYRNAYDLVVIQSGAVYVTDNGANAGWGGLPVNEGSGNVTNNYDPNEPGSSTPTADGEKVNNKDHLELVTNDIQNYSFGSFYGGHPNPTRANPNGAGLYTAPEQYGTSGAVFRTQVYDPDGSTPGSSTNASTALPANWPPVSIANVIEGDWRGPGITNPDGTDDNPITIWGTNTNGIDEYTASFFGGSMQGNLLAGTSGGVLRRVELNQDGSLQQLTPSFLSGIGGNALGVTCNSDTDIFPGTIWAGTLNGKIVVFEPQDTDDATSWRVNAGGTEVLASDIGGKWENNASSGYQQGSNYNVNTGQIVGTVGVEFENKDLSIPAYIDQNTFDALLAEERFDSSTSPEMEYTFTLNNGDYVVNLFMSNSYAGTSQTGDRIFDILLEDAIVKNDLDLITEFGHQVAGMLSFPVSVSDGELNLSFGHEVENPTLNAIEIFRVNPAFPTLTLDLIADQNSAGGEQLNLATSAFGGDPSEGFSFYMTGQPEGLSIDEETGVISGTVDFQAASGGPNGNGVHVVRVSVLKPGAAPSTQVFTWTITLTLLWTDKDENENYTGRHECSFVQAGDKFYLMGGRENPTTLDVYDYNSDSWTALTNSSPEEFNHFQAIEYQGLIWIIGAFEDNNFPNEIPEEHIWIFDPANEEWIQGLQIPANRRRGSTGVSLYNDKFYVTGGNTDGHDGGYVAWFDEFDPSTGTWTALPDAPRERDHFHTAVIGDKLYAVGGRLSGGTGGIWKPTVPEVDVFDFTTGTWSTLPAGQNIPTPRGGAMTANFNNKLMVIGGEVQDESVYGVVTDDALKITEEYDPIGQSWTRLADMNFERHGTQAIVSGPGVFILAGSPNRAGGSQKNMEFLGHDAPIGSVIDASTLDGPALVFIADGNDENITMNVSGGNQAIYVRSMEITGPNAADFVFDSGKLTNSIISPSSDHNLSVSLSGTGENRSATLTVNYGINKTLAIALTNDENLVFSTTNPGPQFNFEGDNVTLQIEASSPNTLSFDANNLPPTLSINPNTGIISGGISSGSGSNGAAENSPYAVDVTVSDDSNPPKSETLEFNWVVQESGELTAVAQANPLSGEVPLHVLFTGSNSLDDVGVTAYFWDFKDGSTSNEADPAHTFVPAGNYDVSLTVTDVDGNTDTSSITISCSEDINDSPIAVAEATPITGNAPLQVAFTGSNSIDDTGIASYAWDFKDGSTSNEADPIYSFTNPGGYEVELTVEDTEGLVNTETVAILVLDENNTSDFKGILIINPAKEVAQVRLIDNGSGDRRVVKVYLHDSSGRLIRSYSPQELVAHGLYEIPVSTLDSGNVYFIRFEMNKGGHIVLKLIVRN